MKRRYTYIAIVIAIVLLNIAAQWCRVRIDLTEDKRYTLSPAMVGLVESMQDDVEVMLLLSGDMNAGFLRLRNATEEMLDELARHGRIHYRVADVSELPKEWASVLAPVVIHEREQNGRTAQLTMYPYALVAYQGRMAVVPLLKNNRGRSGEENLNLSIQNLEFAFAEALNSLSRTEVERIAFLEGHGELPEANVYDLQEALSKYFQIDRGVLNADPTVLNGYKAVVIADPQMPFSEEDKYVLDQYLMQGGRILWVLNGVRFSSETLSEQGMTPVIPLDLHLDDMLFRYGARINPVLVQDVQCLPIPVDVSADPTQPNWQPMPWYYAPLLLTSQASPITRDVMEVSASFVSAVDAVGEDDGIEKMVLLATSTATRAISVPGEVDLSDMNPDLSTFRYAYVPVAMSMEGEFESVFAHRMKPEGVASSAPLLTRSPRTKQIVVASGSVIRNEVERNQALPVGFDRYSGMQFGNRDFLVNAMLYLADDEGLISLRDRTVKLRLLSDKKAHEMRVQVQVLCTLVPLLILLLTGVIFTLIHKRKYTKR